MKGEPDFSMITLKANASGSWLTVLRCEVADEATVREAASVLRNKAVGSLKFKLVDAEGGEIASLGCKPGARDWVEA